MSASQVSLGKSQGSDFQIHFPWGCRILTTGNPALLVSQVNAMTPSHYFDLIIHYDNCTHQTSDVK
jgi:hypothetical protein